MIGAYFIKKNLINEFMTSVEEIKSKLNLIEVLREYVQLQNGRGNFRALCPFHKEKNPSFMASEEKQIWKCFGCGAGGDMFSFVMKIENIEFKEALKILALKAGVELHSQKDSNQPKRNRVLDVINSAMRYYTNNLINHPLAQSARDYLLKRGLKQETINEWKIGFSLDDWNDLLNYLKKQGWRDEDIFEAGLSVKKDSGYGFYNRFRGRIMFPIYDLTGNPIAFTARLLPDQEKTSQAGKYINSPQGLLYDKSKIIFALNFAKNAIKDVDLTIVVEGQMDAITAHEAGFKNVVASSGTALTTEQLNILKRYSNHLALAFDADQAGQMAVDRAIDEALKLEMEVKIIIIPNGKDPDDCIRKAPEAWIEAVKNAMPAMEYYFKKYLSDLDLSVLTDKRKAAQKILPKILNLNNPIEKDFYLKKFSAKIGVDELVLRETLKRIVTPKNNLIKPAQIVSKPTLREPEKETKISQKILALLIKFPFLLELATRKMPEELIDEEKNKIIYSKILIYYNSLLENDIFSYKFFRKKLEEENINSVLIDYLDNLTWLGDSEFSNLDNATIKKEFLNLLSLLKENKRKIELKEIERLLAQAEEIKDKVKIDFYVKKFQELSGYKD